MTAPHPAADATPAPQETDPADSRTERRLARLERLAEKGVGMAEALPEDGAAESADSFAKLSRAVRLTSLLEEKLENALAARRAGLIAKVGAARAAIAKAEADRAEDPYAPLETGRRGRARDLVIEALDRETPDPAEADALIDALDERLLCDEAYDRLDDLPLRDIVERLCADLQLKPDWRRWTGEGWTPNPPFHRPLCSPFARPSRTPILDARREPPEPDPLERRTLWSE